MKKCSQGRCSEQPKVISYVRVKRRPVKRRQCAVKVVCVQAGGALAGVVYLGTRQPVELRAQVCGTESGDERAGVSVW